MSNIMVAPSAMLIESANDQLQNTQYVSDNTKILLAQMKEIQSAVPNKDSDFYAGYMLGIQTARVYLLGNPPAVFAKVSI